MSRLRRRAFRLRARFTEFSDEATEIVAPDELLADQLEARLGRGVVGLEPLLDGAALVRVAVHLSRRGGQTAEDGLGVGWCGLEKGGCGICWGNEKRAPCKQGRS